MFQSAILSVLSAFEFFLTLFEGLRVEDVTTVQYVKAQ